MVALLDGCLSKDAQIYSAEFFDEYGRIHAEAGKFSDHPHINYNYFLN